MLLVIIGPACQGCVRSEAGRYQEFLTQVSHARETQRSPQTEVEAPSHIAVAPTDH